VVAVDAGTCWIGLDGWVLQDGNYTEFEVGERRMFALEVATDRPDALHPTDERQPRAAHTGADTTYDVVAHVMLAVDRGHGERLYVVDLGAVRAYTHHLRRADGRAVAAGDWLAGRLMVFVDHFSWMDAHAHEPGMPPLVHTWTVEAIEADETPWAPVEPGHPSYVGPDEGHPVRVRDRTREQWRPVERTASWDDDGNYRLLCRLDPAPPSPTVPRRPGWPVEPLPG
jgi:hypothetical protein